MPLLIDFKDEEEAARWRHVDDQVMGGGSHSEMHSEPKAGVFAGELTLSNGAGFASVRREPESMRLAGYAGLALKALGDGRRYQFRLYTNQLDDGAAYRALFRPPAGEWQHITLPWSDFLPIFRGRMLENAPPLDPGRIQQVGLLIADKVQGQFRLEVASIDTF